MKKRVFKKSEVLKEGYLKGLRRAKRIISEMLAQSQGFNNDFDEFNTKSISGKFGADAESKQNALSVNSKREFISMMRAILQHTQLYVTNTLGGATAICGIADDITSNGVLIDNAGKKVADFSDWSADELEELEIDPNDLEDLVIDSIDSKSLIIYQDGQKYTLTCYNEDDDFDLIKFLLINNRRWQH